MLQRRASVAGESWSLRPPDISKMLHDWLSAEQLAQWQASGQVDFALAGWQGHALRQRICQPRGLSLRVCWRETCLQLEALGVPAASSELLNEESRLITVTSHRRRKSTTGGDGGLS